MATQPISPNTLQFPATMDLITDLVKSVNGLKESVAQLLSHNNGLQISVSHLERDNNKLREAITILERTTGVLFPQFPKLPSELRR